MNRKVDYLQTKGWKDLRLELRHDFIFILAAKLSRRQVEALAEDLRGRQCNVDVKQDEEEAGNWYVLVGLNSSEVILLEADI